MSPVTIFRKLWGFKDCNFGTINERYISRYQRERGDLIRLRNGSKLVERSLFAIIYPFLLYMACGGMFFLHKISNLKFFFSF